MSSGAYSLSGRSDALLAKNAESSTVREPTISSIACAWLREKTLLRIVALWCVILREMKQAQNSTVMKQSYPMTAERGAAHSVNTELRIVKSPGASPTVSTTLRERDAESESTMRVNVQLSITTGASAWSTLSAAQKMAEKRILQCSAHWSSRRRRTT